MRTYLEVLGLDLEASSPRKLSCPRLEDSTIFCTVKIILENARNLEENLQRPFLFSSFGVRLKKIFEDLFLFFLENTCAVSLGLGLGLEHPCPWPRKGLSSEGLSLALDFFMSLALASSLVSSTLPLLVSTQIVC